MTTVEIEVGFVEAEFEVSPTQAIIEAGPTTIDLSVTPPDLFTLDIAQPSTVELTITEGDTNVTVAQPPIVNFSLGGGAGGGEGGGDCHVPPGGAKNKALTKRSHLDYDVQWGNVGNTTYYTPPNVLPPEEDLIVGDLWIDGEDNNATYRWDGVQWVDVHNLNIDNAAEGIQANSDAIILLNQQLTEMQVHVEDAEKSSNTADGRVSMSDYEPTAEDIYYSVIKTDPITGENVVVKVERVEGSIWFQRTRPRLNMIFNPSFEKNIEGWQGQDCTIEQTEPADAASVAGTHCLLVTSFGANPHVETVYAFPANEAEWYAASAHMLLLSGSGAGCYAMLTFYDDAEEPLLMTIGEVEDLPVEAPTADAWDRINVVAQAPPGATHFRVHFHNPNPADVWYLGAAIIENLDEMGKYFDGDSYDAWWTGGTGDPLTNPDDNPGPGEQGWQESPSRLRGDKIIGVWELHAQTWVRKFFTEDTLDQIDARKINNLEQFSLADNTITTRKTKVAYILSSEEMTKGDVVNIYDADGQFRVRRASAALNFEASGFILDDVPENTPVLVYTNGMNVMQLGLLPGPKWLSETAGLVSNVPPTSAGTTVQQVGWAADTFVLNFHIRGAIRII